MERATNNLPNLSGLHPVLGFVGRSDDEGNRLTRTRLSNNHVTRYEWDHRNRLTKVTEEDDSLNVLQVTIQSYDAFNQWIRRNFDEDGPGGTAAIDTFFAHESGQ